MTPPSGNSAFYFVERACEQSGIGLADAIGESSQVDLEKAKPSKTQLMVGGGDFGFQREFNRVADDHECFILDALA